MSPLNRLTGATAEQQVVDLFRKAGWSVVRPAGGPDAVIRKGDVAYAVEVKRAAEGRTDRLVPLLAQAILQAQSHVHKMAGVAPLAIISARHIPPRVVDQLNDFASAYAPEVAVGIIDSRGLRAFSGTRLESLNARPMASVPRSSILDRKAADLFSDLNQWLLKMILAPYLDDPNLLNAPLLHYGNASELAQAAGVSLMTASRLLRRLRLEGFLHESISPIRLVRLDELFRRWLAAAGRPTLEIAARFPLPGDPRVLAERAMRPLGEDACVGLFAAADALHLGVVRGVATHVYVRELSPGVLTRMQLTGASRPGAAEVFVRVPSAPESVFRGAVDAGGIRSADILQVWLDVHDQPSRGKEQAAIIYRRIIGPMLKRARHAA